MACYLCQGENINIIRTKLRHDVQRNVLRCGNCDLVFLEPKKENLGEFYGKDYRKTYSPKISGSVGSKQIFDLYLPYQEARIEKLKHILRPDMKVLDIGCSAGHFLHTLKKHVGECVGLEYNEEDAEFVESELGFKVYQTPIEQTDLPHHHFDLITLFQTLEHIDDPLAVLKNVAEYLKPDGYICIEVPNIDEALLSVYQLDSFADFWYREPHLFNYSPQTLTKMMKAAGFDGEVQTIQRINFLNHLSWLLTNKPQEGPDVHMAQPKLVESETVDQKIKSELNSWFAGVDQEYRDILNKHYLGESVLFIGQKSKS